MFGKVMKQELRANSLLYGVASAIALLFAFATVINRTRGTDVSYLVKAALADFRLYHCHCGAGDSVSHPYSPAVSEKYVWQ